MSNIFETVLRMSFAASLVVVALLVFRPVLKKLPGGLLSLLWLMVAIRLIFPVLIESRYSLIPLSVAGTSSVTKLETDAAPLAPPPVIEQESLQVPTVQPEQPITESTVTENTIKKPSALALGANIWLAGIGIMLIYFVVSYLRIKSRVAPSVKAGDRLYICDGIDSPFIMGIFSPRIYLPSDLQDEYRDVIVLHERTHISRGDHLQKMIGYLFLSLHWFNPFIWCAYWLFCKDIEIACDERVINGKASSYKKLYASALLYCCTKRHGMTPCRVSFGEINIKQRIVKVVKYKKASTWIVVTGFAIGAVIAVFLLTNPNSSVDSQSTDDTSITDRVVQTESSEESVQAESEEYSAEESADTSASEESTEKDTSADVSIDVDRSEEETETKPVSTPVEHLSLQSTHTTADGISPEVDCRRYGIRDLVPVYVSLYDKELVVRHKGASSRIEESGHTVWLCDSNGKRIDYVTTNSIGLAKFEVYEGSYTIHFDGTDVYAPHTTSVFTALRKQSYFPNTPIEMFVATYKKASFSPCTVTVLDADTGKPISNVHVTRYKYKDSGFYTDANGIIKMPPLIEYNGTGDSYCGLTFTREGYIIQSLDADVFKNAVTIKLSKLKEYPYTVRIIDADTGEGVEGVWLILSDYADTGRVDKRVSGKDGVVSGSKNSNELALYPQINLYYSAEGIPYEQRTEKGTGLYSRLSIVLTEGSNEYTVYLKTDKKNQTVTLVLKEDL